MPSHPVQVPPDTGVSFPWLHSAALKTREVDSLTVLSRGPNSSIQRAVLLFGKLRGGPWAHRPVTPGSACLPTALRSESPGLPQFP